MAVTVRNMDRDDGWGGGGAARSAGHHAAMSEPRPGPRPRAASTRIPDGPRPDLRSLPAFGIQVIPRSDAEMGLGRDRLAFAATVWNRGTSPLVVDGFRRRGEDVMDAYQYFYDRDGRQVGHTKTGVMEYDDRDGHDHWHFLDFAAYRLLDADKKRIMRSGKEAFCLVPTDAVHLALKGANWNPYTTDLHSACGQPSSLAIRETLDVGWGDTYGQYLPGQSFDIETLPNGTYFIEVTANPDGRLHELRTTNNTSLRKVILGGKPGARTVEVPPHKGIDAR